MTVTFIDIVEMGAILSPGPLPWEEGVDFPRSTLLRDTNTNFQLPSSKTVILLEIVVKWGQFYPLGPSRGWGGCEAGS